MKPKEWDESKEGGGGGKKSQEHEALRGVEVLLLNLKLQLLMRKFEGEEGKTRQALKEFKEKLESGDPEKQREANEGILELWERFQKIETIRHQTRDNWDGLGLEEDKVKKIKDLWGRLEKTKKKKKVAATEVDGLRLEAEGLCAEILGGSMEVEELGEFEGEWIKLMLEVEAVRDRVAIEETRRKIEEGRESEAGLLEKRVKKEREEIVESLKPREGMFSTKSKREAKKLQAWVEEDLERGAGLEELSQKELLERWRLARENREKRLYAYAKGGDWDRLEKASLALAKVEAMYEEVLWQKFQGEIPWSGEVELELLRGEFMNLVDSGALANFEAKDWPKMVEKFSSEWERAREEGRLEKFGPVSLGLFKEGARGLDTAWDLLRGGADREMFVKQMVAKQGLTEKEAERLFEQLNMKASGGGSEISKVLSENVAKGDYVGYVRELIAYLSKVGIREGMNDMRLLALMNEARAILKDEFKVSQDILKIYDAWVTLEIYGGQFGYLGGMKEYHQLLQRFGLKGLESLTSFLTDESRDAVASGVKLSGEALVALRLGKEGEEVKEKEKQISVWRLTDMLEDEAWLSRLSYAEVGHEAEVYDAMVASLLLSDGKEFYKVGGEGNEKWIEIGGERKLLKDIMVEVNGKQKSLAEVLVNHRWMARTAEHISNLTLRSAHLLKADFGKGGRWNKNIVSITQFSIYSHTFGIVPAYLRMLNALDGLMYSLPNYKGIVGKTLFVELMRSLAPEEGRRMTVTGKSGWWKSLLEKVGVGGEGNVEIKDHRFKEVASRIEGLIKQKRVLVDSNGREHVFKTNYLGREDLPWILHDGEVSFEEARKEFVRRRRMAGTGLKVLGDGSRVYEWEALSPQEQRSYQAEIELFQKRLNQVRMSRKDMFELGVIEEADLTDKEKKLVEKGKWKQVISRGEWEKFAEHLNKEWGWEVDPKKGLAGIFGEWSYATFSNYGEALKPTDMENFGKYNELMEGAVATMKSGYQLTSTKAFLELFGFMGGYLNTTGADVMGWMRLVFDRFKAFRSTKLTVKFWETSKTVIVGREEIETGKGNDHNAATVLKRDLAGEMVRGSSREVIGKKKEVMHMVNLGKKFYNLPSKTMTEWIMTLDYLVSKGMISKEFRDSFLGHHYGPRIWRWLRMAVWFDDPVAAAMFMAEMGAKEGVDLLKYVTSGLTGQ